MTIEGTADKGTLREALRRFASEVDEMSAEATQGPFLWGEVEPESFLVETARRTEEHGDAQASAWVVQTRDADDPVTVAYCGNGPLAHRNAELIAHLLNNVGGIAALSSKDDRPAFQERGPEPLDVERLARARHRWQHPTFTLDLSPVKPGKTRRCGCRGWAETVREMLDLLDHDEQAAALSKETPA